MERRSQRKSDEYPPYRYIISHLSEAGRYDALVDLLEKKGFLAQQARHFQGFQQGTEDLESYVLSATIDREDWPRFLRYALVAINYRGLAEALAEEELLGALVARGNSKLASSLVDQLPDPGRQAAAGAVVLGSMLAAGSTSAADTANAGLRRLRETLDAVPRPTDEDAAEEWIEILSTVARHLPPASFRAGWARWIARLPTETLIEKAWKEVTESWLKQDLSSAPELWHALAAIRDRAWLRRALVRRLASSPTGLEETIVDRGLPAPFERDEELLWHARLAVLGRWLEERDGVTPEVVLSHLEHMSIDWSAELLETGRAIWPQLREEELEALASGLRDPSLRAGLRVLGAHKRRSPEYAEAARCAIAALPSGLGKLHWQLRALKADNKQSPGEVRRRLRWAMRYLRGIRYQAAAEDLARFLDMVAEHWPKLLARQFRRVAWAPATSPDTLRRIAVESRCPAVLAQLFENGESYAAVVSTSESASFALRRELLIRTASRLCAESGDLSWLERAARRLLPEEEDQLRRSTVEALLAREALPDKPPPEDLPLQICDGIRSNRRKLLTLLLFVTDEEMLGRLLDPAALYRAMVDTDVIDDERLALEPLRQVPRDPQELCDHYLNGIRNVDRRIEAMTDLARHSQQFERAYPPPLRDMTAGLQPLLLAAGGLSSDARRATFLPALVEAGVADDVKRGAVELQNAIEYLLGLESVKWNHRLELLETVIAGMASRLLDDTKDQDGRWKARCRALVRLFGWIARQASPPWSTRVIRRILRLPEVDADRERRRRCQDLLPIVLAVAERLPEPWRYDARRRILAGRRRWPSTGRPSPDEPTRRTLRRVVRTSYRLSGRVPARVPQLLDRLPPGDERDHLAVQLIRHRWIRGEPAREVAKRSTGRSRALWAKAWLDFHEKRTAGWLNALTQLVVAPEWDPSDPRHELFRQALRESGSGGCRRVLARATIAALEAGGRPRGEGALRLWLHTYPSFDLEWSAPAEGSSIQELTAALRAAQQIAPTTAPPPVEPPIEQEAKRFFEVHRRCLKHLMAGVRKAPKMLESPFRLAFRVAVGIGFILAPLDAIVWPNGESSPAETIPAVLVWPAIALFGVLFLTNALVIDRFLAWSTFGDERFRPWVRFGRFALAGVPIVGLWTVALWRWIAARPPPWALREPVRSPDGEDAEPHGGLLAGPRALAFTWLGSGDHIAVLMLFNWLGMMFISLVSARALSSPWGWAGLVVWTAAFHGIGFGLMLYSLTEAARVGRLSGVRRWIYCGLAVLWLIPFPFLAIVGGLLVVLWDAFLPAFKRVETSVVYRAVEGGRGYSRLALRMGLERELRRCLAWLPWRHRLNYFVLDFERRQRPSRLENQILKLTRVKTFFLPFDSSCLAFLALKIADGSHHAGTISGILIRIGGLALVVGLTSFLIALLSQLIRRPRRPGARIVVVRPLQRLASTQLALAAGLWGGVGLAHGDPMRVASILAWGGGVLALAILYGHRLGLFNLPDSTEKDDNVSGVLALMFGVVWGIGFYLRLNPDIADAYLPVLLDAVCWLPLLGVALGWILLPWLLRPFRWTQIFAKKIPIPIRGLLILLAATAVLPLGGTAMPAWLVLRHRWWPRIELRELRARADSRSPSGSSSP